MSTKKFSYLFEKVWTVPNVLTFLRIILVPVFAVLYYKKIYVWALTALFLSGLTDFLDGKIARHFNQVSALGKVLDPIADKLTEITIAILLFFTFFRAQSHSLHAFAWVFLLFIAKELFMLIGGAVMLSKGIRPGASEIFGKVATFVFYGVVMLIFAFGPEVGIFAAKISLPEPLMWALVVVSVVLTFGALASYMPSIYAQFREYWDRDKTAGGKDGGSDDNADPDGTASK